MSEKFFVSFITYPKRQNATFTDQFNHFIKNFGDGSVYMGWIGLIIGFIMIGNHHADADKIGPAISVAFLPIFYGYFIKLISTGLEKVGDD